MDVSYWLIQIPEFPGAWVMQRVPAKQREKQAEETWNEGRVIFSMHWWGIIETSSTTTQGHLRRYLLPQQRYRSSIKRQAKLVPEEKRDNVYRESSHFHLSPF